MGLSLQKSPLFLLFAGLFATTADASDTEFGIAEPTDVTGGKASILCAFAKGVEEWEKTQAVKFRFQKNSRNADDNWTNPTYGEALVDLLAAPTKSDGSKVAYSAELSSEDRQLLDYLKGRKKAHGNLFEDEESCKLGQWKPPSDAKTDPLGHIASHFSSTQQGHSNTDDVGYYIEYARGFGLERPDNIHAVSYIRKVPKSDSEDEILEQYRHNLMISEWALKFPDELPTKYDADLARKPELAENPTELAEHLRSIHKHLQNKEPKFAEEDAKNIREVAYFLADTDNASRVDAIYSYLPLALQRQTYHLMILNRTLERLADNVERELWMIGSASEFTYTNAKDFTEYMEGLDVQQKSNFKEILKSLKDYSESYQKSGRKTDAMQGYSEIAEFAPNIDRLQGGHRDKQKWALNLRVDVKTRVNRPTEDNPTEFLRSILNNTPWNFNDFKSFFHFWTDAGKVKSLINNFRTALRRNKQARRKLETLKTTLDGVYLISATAFRQDEFDVAYAMESCRQLFMRFGGTAYSKMLSNLGEFYVSFTQVTQLAGLTEEKLYKDRLDATYTAWETFPTELNRQELRTAVTSTDVKNSEASPAWNRLLTSSIFASPWS
eukprot:GHVU01008668.1.p1 GENE.GHVU01008668.1~~GHVU01008668.1.p1  ORF type:complete len:609 (+),score=52.94 GHVU01008668.1:39-1865(+)